MAVANTDSKSEYFGEVGPSMSGGKWRKKRLKLAAMMSFQTVGSWAAKRFAGVIGRMTAAGGVLIC